MNKLIANKAVIARAIVFVLVWVNTFLAAHNYKTIPVVDSVTVAGWLAFIYSAYVEGKHIYKWIKDNWLKKQVEEKPITPIVEPLPPAPVSAPTEPVQPVAPQDNQTK